MLTYTPPEKQFGLSNDSHQEVGASAAPITCAADLATALTDRIDPGVGLRRFREFLAQCSTGAEEEKAVATANREILSQYLKAQCLATDADEDDKEERLRPYYDLIQIWSLASKKNTIGLLSLVPATLANLLRLFSQHDELKLYGATLVKAVLSPNALKIIYRSLTSSKEYIASPCLRLLTEMNRYNSGAMCCTVYQSFDFTLKDLPRNIELMRGASHNNDEDPKKPSVRMLFVRFLLSFFHYGSSSIKNNILGLRQWMTPLFRHLKTDTPVLLRDILETMSKDILADCGILNSTKAAIFNEWALGQVATTYSRDELVEVLRSGKKEKKTIAAVAHEFLTQVCTTPNNGVCFPDQGWYPKGVAEGEGKYKGGLTLFNRTLSSFLAILRPYADSSQLDLVLAIFRASPELVAAHFMSAVPFYLEPKPTSTWVGYNTFLLETICLPVPDNFGATKQETLPPPVNIIVENILPKPLTKAVMTQCLTSKNNLIRFLGTRLLVVAFQKLRAVLSAMDTAMASFIIPVEQWTKCKLDILEAVCRRFPEINSIGGASERSIRLLSEAKTRLLAEYHCSLPDMAVVGRLDVNTALGKLLDSGKPENSKGLEILEIGHMLKVAKAVPDIRRWSKPASMPYSLFVSLLKLCCTLSASLPINQIRELLYSFSSSTHLFQRETPASPLDALVESLYSIRKENAFEAVLSLVDLAITNCVRVPFKYLDAIADVLSEAVKDKPAFRDHLPVSAFVFSVVEQWNFCSYSGSFPEGVELETVVWLRRYMESLVLLGENELVINKLCKRLANNTQDRNVALSFTMLATAVLEESDIQIVGMIEDKIALNDVEPDNNFILRPLFTGLCQLSLERAKLAAKLLRERAIRPELLDLSVVQKAIVAITQSKKVSHEDANTFLGILFDIMNIIVYFLINEGSDVGKTESFLACDGPCLKLFLNFKPGTITARIVTLSKAYAHLLSEVFWHNGDALSKHRGTLLTRIKEFLGHIHRLEVDQPQETTAIFRTILPLISYSEDAQGLVEAVLANLREKKNSALESLLAVLISFLMSRGYILDKRLFISILSLDSELSNILTALCNYLLNCPVGQFLGLASCISGPDLQIGAPRKAATRKPTNPLNNHKSRRVAALLDSCSVYDGKIECSWRSNITSNAKALLQQLFSMVCEEYAGNISETWEKHDLLRAAFLFPSLDPPKFLKHIADGKQQFNVTSTVPLIDALLGSLDLADIPNINLWLLGVFEHLTRRFAEDAVLSTETLLLTMKLGKFLGRNKIKVTEAVPRATLNALIEAALQMHIDNSEVVCFIARVISLASPKSIDVAKILHITLGHERNPLSQRGFLSDTVKIHRYLVFLLRTLFSACKRSASIITLDGILSLYRGSNDFVDKTLLEIIIQIEARLTHSCASRISSWSLFENVENKPLVSRSRGSLSVTVDAKLLFRGLLLCASQNDTMSQQQADDLDLFMDTASDQESSATKAYDPNFLLPILAYCLKSPGRKMHSHLIVERNCISFAITALASFSASVRIMAVSYLGAVVTELENSTYQGKVQINHLLCCILAAFEVQEVETQAIPVTVAVFLSQAVIILTNPSHFMYGKVMEMLLARPNLELRDLPYLLGFKQISEVGMQKETLWILNILAAGLRTEIDLALLRERKVFNWIINLFAAPYTTERSRDKIVELLWNAGVQDSSVALITRHATFSWIEQQLYTDITCKRTLERLMARLYDASFKGYVQASWSRGGVGILLDRRLL